MNKKNTDLEKEEKEKYNYLVERHGFGCQPDRRKHIDHMLSLGSFTESYLEILSSNAEAEVLEIGVGPGTYMEWLKREYNMLPYGIDISEKMVEYAIKIHPHFSDNILVGNAAAMPYSDNRFTLVQHLDGMEHIPAEWEFDALSEAVRVSSDYIVYNNACGRATADHWARSGGFTDAHINQKRPEEWSKFYNNNKNRLKYKIEAEHYEGNTSYMVILKKV